MPLIDLSGHCLAQLNRDQGIDLQELLTRLRKRGVYPPSSSRAAIAKWAAAEPVIARHTLRDVTPCPMKRLVAEILARSAVGAVSLA